MKILMGFLLGILLSSLIMQFYIVPEAVRYQEYGYFEGQRDCLNGDVRIYWNGTNYIWLKSCWNNGDMPTYNVEKVRTK